MWVIVISSLALDRASGDSISTMKEKSRVEGSPRRESCPPRGGWGMEGVRTYLTTAESLVFMLLGGASHPQFRTIATLIKEHAAGATSPFEELVKTNAAL